ncbi:MAG: ROK family protein [Phycisphaerae bacterium]|nr:ROK family protein [Phycisphaerae bacterium]
MAQSKPVVGIDLGGTNMQIAVVSPERTILGRAKKKTKPDDGRDAVLARIAEGVQEACADAKIALSDLAGLGIGAPGAIEPSAGVVLEAVNLRWNDVPLADLLRKRLNMPAFVDNDVNVAVYAENVMGAGEQSRDLLGVWVGTGIGGGLILNGAMYYGTFFTAGEIGHTILFPGIPLGSRSLEHNCSRTAVVDRIVRLVKSNRRSVIPSLVDGDLEQVKSKTVAKAYQMGDELTVQVVDHVADLLGIAIANVVTLLSLPRVVLGGGLTEALGDALVERVKKSARANVFPDKCKQVKVVATRLLDDAGALGAALIAQDRLG